MNPTAARRRPFRAVYLAPACAILLAAAGTLPASAQQHDIPLESAENILDQVYGQTRDASTIISTLRSTRDPGLLPLFARLATVKNHDVALNAMISQAIVSKDPSQLDFEKILNPPADPDISPVDQHRQSASALAALIDANAVSNEQLQSVLKQRTDGVYRTMAASELLHRKALTDTAPLRDLLQDPSDVVKYYAAVTLLETKNDADIALGLAKLTDLSKNAPAGAAPVQALMLARIRLDKITAGGPWAEALASDPAVSEDLRMVALQTVLAFKLPAGPPILAGLIADEKDTFHQIKLGLIAIEFADQLTPAQVAPLEAAKSALPQTIGRIARRGAAHADITADLIDLLKLGHPIVLTWALDYAQRATPQRALAIRTALVKLAKVVDERRDQDFELAARAAQQILETHTPASRQTLADLLKSDNPAVVEAVMLGLVRSDNRNLTEFVLPFWTAFSQKQSTTYYNAANYAALILAREGHKQPREWLAGMITGGAFPGVESIGFRAMAGWYYAKLAGEDAALLKRVIAAPDKP